MLNIITFDSPVFARKAAKTSLIKSQGAMNFLFVRIYKSANVEYLEMQNKETAKKFHKAMKIHESAITQNALYVLYSLRKERFRNFLREVFVCKSIIDGISKYFDWKRKYDAGLATA